MDYGNDGNGYKSRSFGQRGENGGGGGGGYRSASERSVIQIPGTHIGKIIGPAGRHINEMQRQFNVRIQINKMVNSKELSKTNRTFQAELFRRQILMEQKMRKFQETIWTTFKTQSRRFKNKSMRHSKDAVEASAEMVEEDTMKTAKVVVAAITTTREVLKLKQKL
jgi:polyribonucleotide nucleotidyltransferase